MTFRHLPLLRQNRFAKLKFLQSLQSALDIPGTTLLASQERRARRTHLALLDDHLTTSSVQSVEAPLFVCPSPSANALALHQRALFDRPAAAHVLAEVQRLDPSVLTLLPELPTPRVELVEYLRPKTWQDPETWVFPAYGRGCRVALGATVRRAHGVVELHPLAYASSSGRLFRIAAALASMRDGIVWLPSPGAKLREPVESLVLYNSNPSVPLY